MLTDRFNRAITFAAEKHRTQVRKGSGVPYISHPLAVASMVLEYGGDEDQAVAALLHDTVEDCGGPPVLDEIKHEFGTDVAGMVEALSDAAPMPGESKAPWRGRKEAYLSHLPDLSSRVRLISSCDKLHNARAIYRDLTAIGLSAFTEFKGGLEGTLWYYRSLADIFLRSGPVTVARELDRVVSDIESAYGTICESGQSAKSPSTE